MKSPNLEKKQYTAPDAEVISLTTSVELLTGSEYTYGLNILEFGVDYNEEGL